MAKKKVWKEWRLEFQMADVSFQRNINGSLTVYSHCGEPCDISPREARRLFQKLSSDYRD